MTTQSPTPNRQFQPAPRHRLGRQFFDENKPATVIETQLTQELADTAWRFNRIPRLEAALLDRAANPPSEQARIDFDTVDAHRALATLGIHYLRLSRQFQKEREGHDPKEAAALLEFHQRTSPAARRAFFSPHRQHLCLSRARRNRISYFDWTKKLLLCKVS
jgi:hypothetical protein